MLTFPKTMSVRVIRAFYHGGKLVPVGKAAVEFDYPFARELIANGKAVAAEAPPAPEPAKPATPAPKAKA